MALGREDVSHQSEKDHLRPDQLPGALIRVLRVGHLLRVRTPVSDTRRDGQYIGNVEVHVPTYREAIGVREHAELRVARTLARNRVAHWATMRRA